MKHEIFLLWKCLKLWALSYQAKAHPTIMTLMNLFEKNRQIIDAMFSGAKQYPRTHILWRNDIVPPNSTALRVTTPAPHQTRTKTIANSSAAWSSLAVQLIDIERIKQRNNGPHKSQSLSFWSELVGTSTCFILTHMRLRSRSIVVDTGSSNVSNRCWSSGSSMLPANALSWEGAPILPSSISCSSLSIFPELVAEMAYPF